MYLNGWTVQEIQTEMQPHMQTIRTLMASADGLASLYGDEKHISVVSLRYTAQRLQSLLADHIRTHRDRTANDAMQCNCDQPTCEYRIDYLGYSDLLNDLQRVYVPYVFPSDLPLY